MRKKFLNSPTKGKSIKAKLWLTLGFLLALSGCASMGSQTLKDVNLPLNTIRETVAASMPIAKRKVSPNGREFFSDYFMVEDGEFRPPRTHLRNYAHVLVLGDRRPYNIEVVVKRERRAAGNDKAAYEPYGFDDQATKILLNRIRENLAKRREDRNFIDDFRAF